MVPVILTILGAVLGVLILVYLALRRRNHLGDASKFLKERRYDWQRDDLW